MRFTPLDIPGPQGRLETLVLTPSHVRGIALIVHPNPAQGGSNTNKVVHTLAKALARLGYIAYCPNLRGVGRSEGSHEGGIGEIEDMQAILHYTQAQHGALPLCLAGFSFGSWVQSQFAARLCAPARASFDAETLPQRGTAPRAREDLTTTDGEASAAAMPLRLVLVGTATSRWPLPAVPADTLLIHGEEDDVIPLASVLDWARPQSLPVVVVPGGGHFFHGKLALLAALVERNLRPL